MLHLLARILVDRVAYRKGIPFVTSLLLAVVTAVRPRMEGPTSIWIFVLLALIATLFSLLCGGRFRIFYVTVAVVTPFLCHLEWMLRTRFLMLGFPIRAVAEYFLYFVAAPILLVWKLGALLDRKGKRT
ncbi:MAG: hypothetical protein AB1898_22860 [Acidobacteriota bacterium]